MASFAGFALESRLALERGAYSLAQFGRSGSCVIAAMFAARHLDHARFTSADDGFGLADPAPAR